MKKISTSKRDLERKKLARSLSEIMSNPETPTAIYDSLGDLICFYANFLDYNSAEIIEMALKAYGENGNGQIPDITREGGLSVIA